MDEQSSTLTVEGLNIHSEQPYVTGSKKIFNFIPERIPSTISGLATGGLIAGILCLQVFIAQQAGIPL